jgi:hypothetical protein
MGKMVRWTKRGGWEIGWTPYKYRIFGARLFRRWQFKGTRYAHNRRRKPISNQ